MCRRMATTAMTTLTGVPRMCGNAIVSICVMLKKQRVVFRVLKYLPVHSVHSREALRVDMHSDVGMLADSHILCHSLWLAVHCLRPSLHRLLHFMIMRCQSKCVCVCPCGPGRRACGKQLQEIMSSDDCSLLCSHGSRTQESKVSDLSQA